jgi:glycosyltransferase involved in cell wall biosynthesis
MVKTRLCIVTNEYLPHAGGIQKVVYAQNRILLHRNYEPFVVTNRIQTPKRYIFDGVKVECYDSMQTGFRLGIPYGIPLVASLETFLKAVKSSDIVHAHGHPYLASIIIGKLAKRYSKPFVLTQHNTFIKYDSVFDKIERLNDLIIGKETLKEADKIIAVSNATRDYVLSLGAEPGKVKVVHNGVDLNRFRPIAGIHNEMRRKLGISKKAVVVLTVRRLVYKNGIDTLIDAANSAVKKNPNIIFLVVGKGPSQNSVRAKIKQLGLENNFRLAGFVSDEELPFYYNVADFFVLPSKSGEGLALVALEAMACGLPVIATDVGGINEVLMDKYGKLVPPNMPEMLAKSILDYSKADLSSVKSEVRELMEEKYSWDKNVDSLVEIYEELI